MKYTKMIFLFAFYVVAISFRDNISASEQATGKSFMTEHEVHELDTDRKNRINGFVERAYEFIKSSRQAGRRITTTALIKILVHPEELEADKTLYVALQNALLEKLMNENAENESQS